MEKITQESEAQKILKDIYFDATTTIRHYDTQRSSFTTIFASLLAVFGSVMVGVASSGGNQVRYLLIGIASAVMLALSITSCLVVIKFNALIALQRRRASIALKRYEAASLIDGLSAINREAIAETATEFGSRFSLGQLWLSIFVILTLVSAGMMAWAAEHIFN